MAEEINKTESLTVAKEIILFRLIELYSLTVSLCIFGPIIYLRFNFKIFVRM